MLRRSLISDRHPRARLDSRCLQDWWFVEDAPAQRGQTRVHKDVADPRRLRFGCSEGQHDAAPTVANEDDVVSRVDALGDSRRVAMKIRLACSAWRSGTATVAPPSARHSATKRHVDGPTSGACVRTYERLTWQFSPWLVGVPSIAGSQA